MAVFGTSTKVAKRQKGLPVILIIGIGSSIGMFCEIRKILHRLEMPAGMYLLFGNAKSIRVFPYRINWQNS
jgi:hypothetical protein